MVSLNKGLLTAALCSATLMLAPALAQATTYPSIAQHTPAKAAPQSATSSEIAKTLKSAMLTDARFTMRRTMAAAGLTITSRGEVHKKADGNWIWDQKTPFPQRIELTNDEMLLSMAGDPVQVMRLDSNPTLYALVATLKALLRLDMATLERTFTVDNFVHGAPGEAWVLHLLPKDPVFQKILRDVTLSGSQKLERVVFIDRNGDKTDIAFAPF